MQPKLTILCTAYNHKNFIRQALDGFIMQKTNFPFEVIVHDDASTDGTAEIIKEYQKKYPEIIKPVFQKQNQFSLGKDILIDFMLNKIHSPYVAINEGDDYWTDENKLQKQVDFLDSHPECSMCFHPVKVIWEDNSQPPSIFPTAQFRFHKNILTLEDLLKHNFIQTNSVVYRWHLTKDMWPSKRILPCDYLWHLIHAQFGLISFIPDIMAVYRRHSGGIWTGCCKTDDWFLHCAIPHIRMCKEMEKRFNTKQTDAIHFMEQKMLSVLFKYKKYEEIKLFIEEFSEDIDDLAILEKSKIIVRKNKLKKYKIMKCLVLILSAIIVYLLRLK